jgi:hypothetical protein
LLAEIRKTKTKKPTMTAQLETQEAGLQHGLQGSGALKLDNPGIDAGEGEQEGLLRPSLKFTGHQLFYVFGLDGVGAMVLSGGVNFALAYREFMTFSDSSFRCREGENANGRNSHVYYAGYCQEPNSVVSTAKHTIRRCCCYDYYSMHPDVVRGDGSC